MNAATAIGLAAGFALAVTAGPSAAATAEELVAFLYAGFEDGAVVNRYRAARESESPARFRLVSVENPAQAEVLTVEKVSDCRYTLSQREVGRDDRPPLRATLDFSRLEGIDVRSESDGRVARRFWRRPATDFCKPDGPPNLCLVFTRPSLPLPAAATRERMLAAMSDLQEKACRPDQPKGVSPARKE